MAVEYEEVRYEYTGSTSDLKRATDRAIKILQQIQYQMDAVSGTDISPDADGFQALQAPLQKLIQQAKELKSTLERTTNISQATTDAVRAAKELNQIVRNLCASYADFNDTTQTTASQLRSMARSMREVSAAFRRVQQSSDHSDPLRLAASSTEGDTASSTGLST